MILFKNSPIFVTTKETKDKYQYFKDNRITELKLFDDIENDLKNAIEREEFFLCYQPIFDAKTKNMVSMEVLIRWKHPILGVISPMEFIPIAEKTNLIIPIGEWVIDTACRQLEIWQKLGLSHSSISVNISAIQLQQRNFAESIKEILDKIRFNPEYLELEITEGFILYSYDIVKSNIIRLRELGVKIAIDDFGTGYNCFSNIQNFAIDILKIDRTFTLNIKSHVSSAIIDAIITLGHQINAKITAEGVEKEEQYEYLKKKGCDMVQGYYFSKPLLPEEVLEFYQRMSKKKGAVVIKKLYKRV